jgi:benzoyl-CoA-dihydrodiol lyase
MTQFSTHPDRYIHWKLRIDGPIAKLLMDVDADRPHAPGYKLKLNSYDLGVDIELADAVQRLRFEHPEVRAVIVTSAKERIFCAGANILMLGSSSHPFKVNFCKYTNETRCSIEDAAARSGQHYIAAVNGTASGGGYELASACEEIYLVDDGNSAVSLPEVPLLGVLPGTGGLTRLVDKRRIRRDHADVFSTLAEGLKARRAKEWGVIDGAFPRSRFDEEILKRARELAASSPAPAGARGVRLDDIVPQVDDDGSGRACLRYRHVTLDLDRTARRAVLTLSAPAGAQPRNVSGVHEAGASFWALAAFREMDDALCRLRFDEESIGLVLLKTAPAEGQDPAAARQALLEVDRLLAAHASDWLVREIVLHMARVLRRLDLTARSFFAIVDETSCFAGPLLEIALAADRVYMKNDAARPAILQAGALSGGEPPWLPMSHGLSRLQARFLRDPARAAALLADPRPLDASAALEAGLVTFAPDELDWEEEVRVAVEERLSLSPDALTGMEASLRFPGHETTDSKIYGRLSAWQNWIFTRPNATGDHGALKLYGQPDRPRFDWRRT